MRREQAWRVLCVGLCSMVSACGAGLVGGPDPARAVYFKASLMIGGALPYRFLFDAKDLAPTFFIDARLEPLDLGRTTDTRIFDDRGGTGSGSGNGRDTTVSTGRMTDIRLFSSTAVPSQQSTFGDSTLVDVVRHGDTLFISRPHPDPSRVVTDTALYENGVLVRPLAYWRTIGEPKTGRRLTYTAIR